MQETQKIVLTPEQLAKIKEYQRDFEEKFGKKLYISWPEMKGISIRTIETIETGDGISRFVSLEKLLEDCVNKHGASLEKIKRRDKRTSFADNVAEKHALQDYSKMVLINRLNARKAAALINRDRSVIYHFATYVSSRKNEREM